MTWSMFCKAFAESTMPAAVKRQIRKEALARYMERMNSGRANFALDFRDLIERLI